MPDQINSTNQNSSSHHRQILFQSDAFEIVSIQWNKGNQTAHHNHGWSQCFVLIEDGLFENCLFTGIKSEVQRLEVGQVLNTPVGSEHQMQCLSEKGRTLHVYTPKIIERSATGKFKIETIATLQKEIKLSDPTADEPLRKLMSSIREHSITTHSPFFMNQLFSGISPQMLMAEDLIAQTKTTMATFEASPAFSTIESEVVDALGALIGWTKDQRDGVSVPGGSAANFMAIHCARQKKFPEIKLKGMIGSAPIKIFVSSESHYSFKKACVALGLGTESLIEVPVDALGRMIPEKLDEMILKSIQNGFTPLMVNATAGTTVLGAFDPIEKLSAICQKYGTWLHVDGAWGGPALFSKKLRSLVQGIELADSVAFDAHKLFGAGLTCSFLLTKQKGILLEANDVSGGDYLFHSSDETVDRGKLSWQCGRRADAVSFWTIWKSAGTQGLGDFVDRLVNIREQIKAWVEDQARLELVNDPTFLNICIRVKPKNLKTSDSDWSKLVREKLKDNNQAMVNYSSDARGTFLRLILANPFVQFHHVKQILEWSLEVE